MKRAVITGANSGIGKATCKALLEKKYELIMICRSKEKGEQTLNEFRSLNPGSVMRLMLCDLSSVKAVKQLSEQIQSKFDSIDVLVNNAGAIFMNREITEDGYERTFATNYLAYFQLTTELLPMLKAALQARIVNVSSQVQKLGKLHWDDLQMEKKYNGGLAYSNSKLMDVMFTYQLAKNLQSTHVTANVLHPGGVRTSFGRDAPGVFGFWMRTFGWTMRSPEKAAETVIWLATSPEVSGISGKFFKDQKMIKSSRLSYDETSEKKLWEVTEELIRSRL